LKLPRLSIRWRLTLWYGAILALLLAGFSAAVYYSVQSAWERSLADRHRHDFETVRTYLDLSPVGEGEAGHLPGDVFFMATLDNKIIYHSNAWCRAGLLKKKNKVIEPTVSQEGVWRTAHGQAFRLRSTPIYTGGRLLQVTVAEDTAEMQAALSGLWAILGATFVVGLGCAIGVGYFMAGRSLAPIGKMATKARLITAERLSERLPVDNPNDEIGQMAVVMNETLSRLETSFAQLKAYTANISHELRTPLTAIRSVGEVSLQRARGADELREAIGSMLEEVERLARLVDCFLTLARAEASAPSSNAQPLDLADCARSVVELLRVLAEEKQQELRFEAVPVMVRVDSSLLRQTLINVVGNAIRYTPQGKRILVAVAPNADKAQVQVCDSGPAIPEGARARVFERFYREGATSDRSDGGTGLGLAIARWVVEAHDGSIEFVPAPEGEGNCCRILLPACPATLP